MKVAELTLPLELWNHISTFCDIDTKLALRKVFGRDVDARRKLHNDVLQSLSDLRFRKPMPYLVNGWHVRIGAGLNIFKKMCNQLNQIQYRVIKITGENTGENLYTLYNSLGSIFILNENRKIYRFFHAENNNDICICLGPFAQEHG